MQTIGVLGGFGPDATTHFERAVHEASRALIPPDVNRGYPPMVTVHVRHPPILIGDDGRPIQPLTLDPRLLEWARRLGELADFLVIVANTPHLFVEEIASAAGRPVLSMVDVVVQELEHRRIRRVGLLGLGVPEAYVRSFEREGIDTLTAPPGIRAALDDAILRMLEGRTTDAHRAAARDAVDALRRGGADTTILGCTEIPLLLGEGAERADLVDPGALLARAAVARAVRGTDAPEHSG